MSNIALPNATLPGLIAVSAPDGPSNGSLSAIASGSGESLFQKVFASAESVAIEAQTPALAAGIGGGECSVLTANSSANVKSLDPLGRAGSLAPPLPHSSSSTNAEVGSAVAVPSQGEPLAATPAPVDLRPPLLQGGLARNAEQAHPPLDFAGERSDAVLIGRGRRPAVETESAESDLEAAVETSVSLASSMLQQFDASMIPPSMAPGEGASQQSGLSGVGAGSLEGSGPGAMRATTPVQPWASLAPAATPPAILERPLVGGGHIEGSAPSEGLSSAPGRAERAMVAGDRMQLPRGGQAAGLGETPARPWDLAVGRQAELEWSPNAPRLDRAPKLTIAGGSPVVPRSPLGREEGSAPSPLDGSSVAADLSVTPIAVRPVAGGTGASGESASQDAGDGRSTSAETERESSVDSTRSFVASPGVGLPAGVLRSAAGVEAVYLAAQAAEPAESMTVGRDLSFGTPVGDAGENASLASTWMVSLDSPLGGLSEGGSAAPRAIAERLIEGIALAVTQRPDGDTGRAISQIRLELDPPEWGALTVVVEHGERGTRVALRAESAETRALLEQHARGLVDALQQSGVDLTSLDIGHRPGREHEGRGEESAELPLPDPHPPAAAVRPRRGYQIEFFA